MTYSGRGPTVSRERVATFRSSIAKAALLSTTANTSPFSRSNINHDLPTIEHVVLLICLAGPAESHPSEVIQNILRETDDPVMGTQEIADRIDMSRQGAQNRFEDLEEEDKVAIRKIGDTLVWGLYINLDERGYVDREEKGNRHQTSLSTMG